jgi:hypothetical protein
MFDFENAGAAPVEAAAARYLTLAEFTRVSAQQTHLRNGMRFAEAERSRPWRAESAGQLQLRIKAGMQDEDIDPSLDAGYRYQSAKTSMRPGSGSMISSPNLQAGR